mgnify:CR=1 FL=1
MRFRLASPSAQLAVIIFVSLCSHLLIHVYSFQLAAVGQKALGRLTPSRRVARGTTATADMEAQPMLRGIVDPMREYQMRQTAMAAELGTRPTSAAQSASSEALGSAVQNDEAPGRNKSNLKQSTCAGEGSLENAAAQSPKGQVLSLEVLVVHEHHLKAIGSDLRLLGVRRVPLTCPDPTLASWHVRSVCFRAGACPAVAPPPPRREWYDPGSDAPPVPHTRLSGLRASTPHAGPNALAPGVDAAALFRPFSLLPLSWEGPLVRALAADGAPAPRHRLPAEQRRASLSRPAPAAARRL